MNIKRDNLQFLAELVTKVVRSGGITPHNNSQLTDLVCVGQALWELFNGMNATEINECIMKMYRS